MKFRLRDLQPFNNLIHRWVGFIPVGSIERLTLEDEAEWEPSEDAWLRIRETESGERRIVTRVHAGSASWTRNAHTNEVLVVLCACELPASIEDRVLDVDNFSPAFRCGMERCTSNYGVCPLPVEGGDWVEIPCKGGWLMVNLLLLNPYSVSQLAILRVSWGSGTSWPATLFR